MENKQTSDYGFTLIELLITIAIIGILAAMVLPKLFGPTEQSRSTEARNMLGSIRQLEEAYRSGAAGDGNYLAIPNANTDATADALWIQLGMENANDTSVYFDYMVSPITNTPPTFLIKATRTNIAADAGDIGDVMCLNNLGVWSPINTAANYYKQTPQNPGECACGGANCPGPCC